MENPQSVNINDENSKIQQSAASPAEVIDFVIVKHKHAIESMASITKRASIKGRNTKTPTTEQRSRMEMANDLDSILPSRLEEAT